MIKIFLPKFWYRRELLSYLLWPFSFFYCLLITLYRFYYCSLASTKFPVPVIVVGNITVGGTGKTPLVIYLAELLRNNGYKPGIVSRGYGRKNTGGSIVVGDKSKVEEVGDEALLIFHRVRCPLIVAKNRIVAARELLRLYNCDIIISDDGLQHYRLPRDIEIAVVDGKFVFGNKFCLPAGPLREPISRLQSIDFIVKNFNNDPSASVAPSEYGMVIEPTIFRNVKDPSKVKTVENFKLEIIHAVAGIGMPEKFFRTLQQLDLSIIEHPFPDHHVFCAADFPFHDGVVLMTEKDAVKCSALAKENYWYLEISAKLSNDFIDELFAKLKKCRDFGE